jgi:branched-chain amino acid transport system substrate-binding protein
MKNLRLIGFALGASMALAGSAFGQDIAIGVAGPMTGGEATFGKQMRDGAELAVADINAAGGVLGKKLKLEIGDDACDPKQARSIAEKMAGMKVPFVAGHYCSSSSIPASEAYAEGGVLQITPASTNPTFTERKLWNTFRVCGRDDQQGGVAGAFIAKNYKGKNIAILHDKTTYGKGLADETKKALNKAGGKEKLFEAYTKGDKDFNALVSKLKAAAIDVVYVGGYHQEAGLILRQMRAQGLKAQMISGDAIATNEFCSRSAPIRASAPRQKPWSTSSRPRTSTRKAMSSTPMPRCRCGHRLQHKPRRPTPKRSPRRSTKANGIPSLARFPMTRRATSPSSTTCSTSGRTANTLSFRAEAE